MNLRLTGIRWIALGIGVLATAACSRPQPCEQYLLNPPYVKPEKLVAVPTALPAIQIREYDVCILRRHGAQVIRLGQTWTIVLPSDDVFDNDTAELNDDYKPMLDVVANFLKTYPKISVSVMTFSDKQPDIRTKFGSVNDELTARQSEAVVHYLTKQHTNARLIYAVGKGARDPISWDGSEKSRYLNRRVEIHFRYYRDNTAWY